MPFRDGNTAFHSFCYKPEARVEKKACRFIRIVYKIARQVDFNFGVKFILNKEQININPDFGVICSL